MVDLQGGVRDAVLAAQEDLEVGADRVAVFARRDQHVRGGGGQARGDLPDVQVMDLGDVTGGPPSQPPTAAGSSPAGAASRKIRPDSLISPAPACSISATTMSVAIASARANPVSTMIRPATAVAANA
jgi:hypothetical protein